MIVSVIETIPPIIQCPTQITVSIDNQCQGKRKHNFTIIFVGIMPAFTNVTDNCDSNLTVIQSIPAGSLVTLGNTTLDITVTDSSNNTVCSKCVDFLNILGFLCYYSKRD